MSTDDKEDEKFDYTVLGTGIVESIFAAQVAHVQGKKLLHIDSFPFYGRLNSSLSIKDALTLLLDQYTAQQYSIQKQSLNPTVTIEDFNVEIPFSDDIAATCTFYTEDRIDVLLSDGRLNYLLKDATNNCESSPTFVSLVTILLTSTHERLNMVIKVIIAAMHLCESCGSLDEFTNGAKNDVSINELSNDICDGDVLQLLCKLFTILELLIVCNKRLNNFEPSLSPKLLLCGDKMVKYLVTSGVGNYLEFCTVDQLALWDTSSKEDRPFLSVPSSKESVFNDKSINLLDKRRVMKVLTDAMRFATSSPATDTITVGKSFNTFAEYLDSLKFNSRLLVDFVNIGIIGSDISREEPTKPHETLGYVEGMKILARYVQSLGKWSKTTFLASNFGLYNELVQAFCRNAAVFGAVYLLNFNVEHIEYNSENLNYPFTISGKLKGFGLQPADDQNESLSFKSDMLLVSQRFYSEKPEIFDPMLKQLGYTSPEKERITRHSRAVLVVDSNLVKHLLASSAIVPEQNMDMMNSGEQTQQKDALEADVVVVRSATRNEFKEGKTGVVTIVQMKVYNSQYGKPKNDEQQYDFSDAAFYYIYLVGDSLVTMEDIVSFKNLLLERAKTYNVGVLLTASYTETSRNEFPSTQVIGNSKKFFFVDDFTNGDGFSGITLEDSVDAANELVDLIDLRDDVNAAEEEFRMKMQLVNGASDIDDSEN